MTQLLIGPPVAPYTVLDEEGLTNIENRLAVILDTTGYTDEMAPAIRNISRTLLTQDLPALLRAVRSGPCEECESIHRVHHAGTVKLDLVHGGDTVPMKTRR